MNIEAVEAILTYNFKDRSLLEAALTHSSHTHPSYQRLEFLGDAALGLVFSDFLYLAYPHLDPGQLSIIRAANISTERLARVAVRHRLYNHVRLNATLLLHQVREFVIAVKKEDRMVVHGGQKKAPKFLADIVESVAAAVYVDCGFDLHTLWVVIRKLFEPFVMLNDLEEQPQPVSMLYESCQKDGKHVEIKQQRKGERSTARVFVNGRFVASGSSKNKDTAKLHAAKAALFELQRDMHGDFNDAPEIEEAKQKVYQLCIKKRWSKPIYKVEHESGPPHDKRYITSVQIEVSDKILYMMGCERSKVKGAENSAASRMFCALQKYGYI